MTRSTDIELGELCLDTWLAPGWIRIPIVANELADLRSNLRSSTLWSALKSPVLPKARSMPFHDYDDLRPPKPLFELRFGLLPT